MMAKEIVRFHSIIWPAVLMALDVPLPKKIYGHGWITFNGSKMGKSTGNVIDPFILADRYGVDALRYHLLREMPFGADCAFSNELMITRLNSDLANDLGNLLSRTVAMVLKYFDGTLPVAREYEAIDEDLSAQVLALQATVESNFENFHFSVALAEVFRVISRANKYIDETAPWVLAKDAAKAARLATVLYHLLETIRVASILLSPVMPNTMPEIWRQIGASPEITEWSSAGNFGLLAPDVTVSKGEVLFPRIDMDKEIEYLNGILAPAATESNPTGTPAAAAPGEQPEEKPEEKKPEILIDDFAKLDLRVGKVLSCEAVKKSDKLLCFSLDDGMGGRQILSGIAQYYKPEELVGTNVIFIANLAPRTMRGLVSEGMILSSATPEGYRLIRPEGNPIPGAEVS